VGWRFPQLPINPVCQPQQPRRHNPAVFHPKLLVATFGQRLRAFGISAQEETITGFVIGQNQGAVQLRQPKLNEPLRADRRLLGDGVSPQQRLLRAPDDSRGGIVRAASFDTWPQEVEWLADQVLAARRTGSGATESKRSRTVDSSRTWPMN